MPGTARRRPEGGLHPGHETFDAHAPAIELQRSFGGSELAMPFEELSKGELRYGGEDESDHGSSKSNP